MRRTTVTSLVVALGCLGCHGYPGGPGTQPDGGLTGGGGAAGATSAGGAGAPGDASAAIDARQDGGDAGPSDARAPAFVGIRLLSNAEYAKTIQYLLGLTGLDQQILAPFNISRGGPSVDLFDNGPGASIPPPQYSLYYETAVSLVAKVFASDTLRARIISCAPLGPADETCARAILRTFGLRAWRRPLTDDELDGLLAVARATLATGGSFTDSIQEAVLALLVSETFLYRVELDPPDGRAHPLTSYELASRLSYLIWSSMPDGTLFDLAATDDLLKPDVLAAQVTRMLADQRSDGLVRNFFGQWLGFRDLEGDAQAFSSRDWSAGLQQAMGEEARLYVTSLVQSDRGLGELLTLDVNFVEAQLANIYGFSFTSPAFTFVQVTNTMDARAGFLGLSAFLATTSHDGSTSPVNRGAWILSKLLCQDIPAPPPNEPKLPAAGTPRQQSNDRLANASCALCHGTMDPVGLGLEGFDQLGRFRTTYQTGEPVDDHGAVGATPYEGLTGLATLLAQDPRFADCARRKALSYALGRTPTGADAPRLAAIDAAWSAAGHSVRGLLAALILDDLFRTRAGEKP